MTRCRRNRKHAMDGCGCEVCAALRWAARAAEANARPPRPEPFLPPAPPVLVSPTLDDVERAIGSLLAETITDGLLAEARSRVPAGVCVDYATRWTGARSWPPAWSVSFVIDHCADVPSRIDLDRFRSAGYQKRLL